VHHDGRKGINQRGAKHLPLADEPLLAVISEHGVGSRRRAESQEETRPTLPSEMGETSDWPGNEGNLVDHA